MAGKTIEEMDIQNKNDIFKWPKFGTPGIDDEAELRNYLVSAEHFRHMDKELERLLRPFCPEGAGREELVRFAADKLVALDAPQTPAEEKELVHKTRQMVRGWFKGTRGTMKRESAIKLSFALGLNDDECDQFLTGALQIPGLLSRNPEEQICIYFLHNAGRQDPPAAWAAKEAMVERFEKDSLRRAKSVPHRQETGLNAVHNTTLIMRAEACAAYRDDEEFYQKAMLGRKEDYTEYSKTVTWAYYDQKLDLIGNIIAKKLEREQTHSSKAGGKLEETIERQVKDFLRELPAGTVDLAKAFADKASFQKIWKEQVRDLCKASPEELLPKIFKKIPVRQLLSCTTGTSAQKINEELRSQNKTAGGLPLSGMRLPLCKYFEDFERDYKNLNDKFYVRQAIMVFFTLNFLYEWEEKDDAFDDHFDEYSPALDHILFDECGLGSLNHIFPLDWVLQLAVFQYGQVYGDEDCIEPMDVVAEVFSVLYE